MQPIKLNIAAGASQTIPCTGSGVWFESGSTSTTNPYIIVKPSTGGAEMRLKPGQSVNGLPGQGFWLVSAEDPAAAITGYLIIGDGDFNDDNTANLVTITGVTNAQALPVKMQSGVTLTEKTPIVVGVSAGALINDNAAIELRIRNTHATATVYLGSSAVTTANSACAIPPGGLWIENIAPNANWYAVSDTASTTVTITTVKL